MAYISKNGSLNPLQVHELKFTPLQGMAFHSYNNNDVRCINFARLVIKKVHAFARFLLKMSVEVCVYVIAL